MTIQAKFYRNHFRSYLTGLSCGLLLLSTPISIAYAEKAANKKDSRANLNSETKKEEIQEKKSVFVVSGGETKTYSNLSEVIEENNALKEQRQILLDHSRLLRDKYKKLYEYCSTGANNCSGLRGERNDEVVPSAEVQNLKQQMSTLESSNKVLEASLKKAKSEIQDKASELASLKKESLNHSASNDELLMKSSKELEESRKLIADKDAEIVRRSEEYAKLQVELENKSKGEKACLDQIETSSNILLKIPELEAEIVNLRNQLLLKKTTAELLGVKVGNTSNAHDVVGSLNSSTQVLSKQVESRSAIESVQFASDVAIVEVVGSKVSLRVGPGTNHSSLMDVQKGTRLTVEAKEGDWLRVNAPTGGRAYIDSNYVRSFDKNGVLLSEAKSSEPIFDPTRDLSVNIDAPEPKKPIIPQKAPKKVSKNKADKEVEPFGEQASAESVAMEKLLQAMSQPEKK